MRTKRQTHPMDELEDLLREAAAADRSYRVEKYRDRIAVFGLRAIQRLESWLEDPRQGAFAVVTIEPAARYGALHEARAALQRGLARARQPVADDIAAALGRLGVMSSRTNRPISAARRLVPTTNMALAELRGLVERWIAEGRPRQPGVPWSRSSWLQSFPAHRAMLKTLPGRLDQAAVRSACTRATVDRRGAEAAFIAVRSWGDSGNGYGPHRAFEILALAGARDSLLAVARTLDSQGVMAAYRRLGDGGDCHIDGLGVAFGTKFLYFCQPNGQEPRALIHDSQISKWLRDHAGLRLSPDSWRPAAYAAYLEQIRAWSVELRCEPQDVEMLIFRSMARPGSHWFW